jgi:hypothetical protein
MTSLFFCALVLLVQAPTQQGGAPAQVPARRDTIYVPVPGTPPTVNVQTPAPSVIVESPSDVPAIILGAIGAILLFLQIWIMHRQTGLMSGQTAAMNSQSDLLARQTALSEQQARWIRDEAIGAFYRIAHDLADEFKKANVMPGTPIPANFDTHPRQMLREAARLFAPLGTPFVFAATATAMYLDRYFEAVLAYNNAPAGRHGVDRWFTVKRLRRQVGNNLDATTMHLPADQRWRPRDGADYHFGQLCAMPADLSEQITGDPGDDEDNATGPGGGN